MLQCCSSEKKVVKSFKICSFNTLFRQKQGQVGIMGHPKSSPVFFIVNNKEIISIQRPLILSKYKFD